MTPFSIEAWERGQEVRTRSGKTVQGLTRFNATPMVLAGTIEGDDDIYTWDIHGMYHPAMKESQYDLVIWHDLSVRDEDTNRLVNINLMYHAMRRALQRIAQEPDRDKRAILAWSYEKAGDRLSDLESVKHYRLTKDMIDYEVNYWVNHYTEKLTNKNEANGAA